MEHDSGWVSHIPSSASDIVMDYVVSYLTHSFFHSVDGLENCVHV